MLPATPPARTRRRFSTTVTTAAARALHDLTVWAIRMKVGRLQAALRYPVTTAVIPCRQWARSCNCCQKAFRTRVWRGAPGSTIYHVVEGAGQVTIGSAETFSFSAKDIFVKADWHEVSRFAAAGLQCYSAQVKPVSGSLGLFREARY